MDEPPAKLPVGSNHLSNRRPLGKLQPWKRCEDKLRKGCEASSNKPPKSTRHKWTRCSGCKKNTIRLGAITLRNRSRSRLRGPRPNRKRSISKTSCSSKWRKNKRRSGSGLRPKNGERMSRHNKKSRK